MITIMIDIHATEETGTEILIGIEVATEIITQAEIETEIDIMIVTEIETETEIRAVDKLIAVLKMTENVIPLLIEKKEEYQEETTNRNIPPRQNPKGTILLTLIKFSCNCFYS